MALGGADGPGQEGGRVATYGGMQRRDCEGEDEYNKLVKDHLVPGGVQWRREEREGSERERVEPRAVASCR